MQRQTHPIRLPAARAADLVLSRLIQIVAPLLAASLGGLLVIVCRP